MKVAFIARNDGTDMRQTKICNSLCRLGHEVMYIGWNREPEKQRALQLDERIQRRVFTWSAGFGEVAIGGWPQFYRYVVDTLARFRPDVVHVRDEPLAAIFLPLKHVLYRHLILDVFDSLAARDLRAPLQRAGAWVLRSSAHIGSSRIIETSDQLKAMLGRHAAKALVVLNVPEDPGEATARDYPTDAALQICTGGSLSRTRDGLETLLKAIERLPSGAVQVQASGWLHDDYARNDFINHPAVRYRWLDSPDDFRRVAARCDALTYLRGDAGATEYRSWVLPNRIFDAMSIGRPIIVSSEMKIARWVEEQGFGLVCDPGDVQGLADLFLTLRARRSELPIFAENVRRIYTSQYTWAVMEQRLKALYDELAAGRSVALRGRDARADG
jgi:glycosyltransferase involved in cell wall biosynthesis